MSRATANLLLLLTACIWGCAFVAQATAMTKMGPILFTGLRFLVAALAVLPFALVEGRGRMLPPLAAGGAGDWRLSVALLSLVFLAGQITQQIGIMGTTVTNAGFLTVLYVILVPFFGVVLFRQWPHPVVWPAALVAVIGTWLLGGGMDGLRTGDYWVMLSAVCWALQVVLLGRIVGRMGRPFFLVFAQALAGALAALALAFLVETVAWTAIVSVAPELFIAGALSGGVAFSLQAIAQRHAEPADAAVVFSTEAVFAALAAAVVLGERLQPVGWLGSGLILAAVLAVQVVPIVGRRTKPSGRPAALPP